MKPGAPFPLELADLRSGQHLLQGDCFRVALLVPMCGAAGIWAPSCISSAQVAQAELNEAGGIRGRKVQLVLVDAAEEAADAPEIILEDLIDAGVIHAIVGMHISAVRHRLVRVLRQRVPYIYTPLYEGGETTAGLFAIGETPDEQLGPALGYLQKRYRPRSWALIGNDYVWPRASHAYAKARLKGLGVTLAMERYVPFGPSDMSGVVESLYQSGAEAVLLSLVGQDCVDFNRAFGRADLHHKMIRLSCAMEENGLIASGASNVQRLFSASSYYGLLPTEANAAFKERYYALHGYGAPVLNALGQSTYEGLQFLAALLQQHPEDWRMKHRHDTAQMRYKSGRNGNATSGGQSRSVYLARADGVGFSIEKEF